MAERKMSEAGPSKIQIPAASFRTSPLAVGLKLAN